MAETLGDIAEWAWRYARREDKQAEALEAAVSFYKILCARIPFDALRTKSDELSMTADEPDYSLSSLDPGVNGIISIRATLGTLKRRLRKKSAQQFDRLGNAPSGPPYSYARFGGNLEFFPTPDSSSYTYRLRYWSKPTISSEPENDEVTYPDEWGELHRWETLYRLFIHCNRRDDAMLLVAATPVIQYPKTRRIVQTESSIIPRLWNDLLRTIDMREEIDDDYGVIPLRCPMTHV